jgi:hypothetical protein
VKLKPLLIHELLDCFDRKYNKRNFRGGSWGDDIEEHRAGYRGFGVNIRSSIVGFRLTKQANEFKATSNPQTARLL